MTQFQDFTARDLAAAEAAFGSQDFSIDGAPYKGIINEFSGEAEVELGGIMGMYNATLVCQKAQFKDLAKPLQKTLKAKTVTMDGIKYMANTVQVDGISVTFGLVYARN